MSDPPGYGTIVHQVRRWFGEVPTFTRVTSGAVDATTNPLTVTVTPGDGGKLGTVAQRIEWDDETGETGLATPTGNDDEWLIERGLYSEILSTHASGARLSISPRTERSMIVDLAEDTINHMWPTIWIPMETTLVYQAANEYYSPTVDDIAELAYVYQLNGGARYPLHATFLTRKLADAVNFPNGAITIPWGVPIDASPIYVAYRAIPTIDNLFDRHEDIVTLGVIAKRVLVEEASHVGPNRSATQRRVGDGAHMRAGAVLLQEFQTRLNEERVLLLAGEIQGADVWAR